VIGEVRFHCGRDAKCPVNAAEVVIREVQAVRAGLQAPIGAMIESAGRSLKSSVQHRVVECSRFSPAPGLFGTQPYLGHSALEQGTVIEDPNYGQRSRALDARRDFRKMDAILFRVP